MIDMSERRMYYFDNNATTRADHTLFEMLMPAEYIETT